MPPSRRLSPVDAAWLRMDRATNPMMITAVLELDRAVPFEEVKRTLDERLREHPRFHARAQPSRIPFAPPHWVRDRRFDLDAHVKRLTLGPAERARGEAALRDLVSALLSQPLDRTRPLWDAHVVDLADDRTAIVARVHHAMGDGVALVRVLLGIADAPDETPPPTEVGLTERATPGFGAKVARVFTEGLTLLRLLFLERDHASSLKGELGAEKRAAFSRAIPLADVRAAARAADAKVNDVLLAAVAGALRAHLGDWPHRLRALVPVYLRGQGDSMGNHFGLVFVDLPDEATAEARLAATKRQMDAIKEAPDALVAMKVLGAMGLASASIERVGIDLFTRKASLLVTNVPGPAAPVSLFGAEVSKILVWAPVTGAVGLGVTLLSYAGEIRMGVSADRRRVADPDALVRAFEAEIDVLTRSRGAGRTASPAGPARATRETQDQRPSM